MTTMTHAPKDLEHYFDAIAARRGWTYDALHTRDCLLYTSDAADDVYQV